MNAGRPKPRHLFRARRHRPPDSFQRAMVQVAAEDLIASPCVVCARPASFMGVWAPSPECIARDLGGDPSRFRRIVYRLCQRCADRGDQDRQFIRTVEKAIIELQLAGNVTRFKDGVVVP